MEHHARSEGRLSTAVRRVMPHWKLVVTLALVGALVLWWASYGIAR